MKIYKLTITNAKPVLNFIVKHENEEKAIELVKKRYTLSEILDIKVEELKESPYIICSY